MPAIAAAHVDAEVMPVAGVDQAVTSTAVEVVQAGDDAMAGSVSPADVANDERPVDEGKESADVSATRNQRQLLLYNIDHLLGRLIHGELANLPSVGANP